jgi:tetratricopeptide (TPR) repeat protein
VLPVILDARGLVLSTDSADAAALFDRAVEHYLKYHADAMKLVNEALAADPEFVMGHCIKAYLMLAGANPAQRPAVATNVAAAEASAAVCTPRERRHVAALAAWQRGAMGEAFAIWRDLLDADPTDLLAVRLSDTTHFRFGHTQAVLEQANRLAPAWSPELPGYECFQSVWAFAHEEAGDTAGAERAIDSAYERDPTNFFAHHVKAHILEVESRPREGNDWLARQTGHWPIGNNLVHHLWWHRALMQLDLGEHDAVLASYDANIRNLEAPLTKAAPDQFNDLQNATSLLWRLEQLGLDVGFRWEELADKAAARIADSAYLLLPPHLMLALAATGRDDACAHFLAALREQASDPSRWDATTISAVVIPVCEAGLAHRRGQHARVVELLQPRLDCIRLLGGSNAQRDLFRQILIDSAMKSDRRDIVAAIIADETATHSAPPSRRAGYAAAAGWLDAGEQ